MFCSKTSSTYKKGKNPLQKCGFALRRVLLLSGLTFGLSAAGLAQGTWTPLTAAAPDYNQGVMLLLNDGSVLAKTSAGGASGIGNGWNRLTPDIHGSYINGTWTNAAGMQNSRLYFSSQVLKNGTVYVAGGEYGTGRHLAEIYYPNDDMWLPTFPLTDPTDTIYDANSQVLPDGRILQAVVLTGHTVSHHTYIYDPATSSFTPGPNTLGIDDETSWLLLKDNSILFPDMTGSTAERYMPATNTWIHDAPVPVNLFDPYGFETGASFLLPDGRSWFLGATSKTAYYAPSGSTANGTWTVGPPVPDSMGAPDAAAAMMVNGKILCALSHTPTFDSVFHHRMRFSEFDYNTNTFSYISAPAGGDSIEAACYTSNMLCLPDGSVLFSRQGDDQYYVYTPTGTPLPAGKPTISNILLNNCDTFLAIGTLFNGMNQGASYGDDWQMATNYPIIRISRHDTIYYASTYNWNSTGVARGTAADTVQFVLPAGIPHGTWQLQVTANGFASDPVDFSFCDGLAVTNTTKARTRISVYPNPASDEVTVSYNSAKGGEYSVKLTDVYGRVVMTQKQTASAGDNTTTLQLNGIAHGIYTASVSDGNDVYNTKVVVK